MTDTKSASTDRDTAVMGALSEAAAADMPAEDLPAEDLPAEDLPAEDLPAEDLPAEDLPAEDLIERFRQTGIRLDREGRLWHQGAEITHPGLRLAILRWLDLRDDGRPILRLDERRYAYIDIEDAALLVLSARWDHDRVWLTLNDGSEEELDYASLRIGASDALYCAVRGGRLRARLTTAAYYSLARGIQPAEPALTATSDTRPDQAGDGSFVLVARGSVFSIFPIRGRQQQ